MDRNLKPTRTKIASAFHRLPSTNVVSAPAISPILMNSNQILMKMRLLLTFNLISSHLKGQSTIADITESLWKFCWKWWPCRCSIFVFLELTCCQAINRESPVDQLAKVGLTPSHIATTIFNILGQTIEVLEVMT
ncbi:hypothetical protein H5410_052655 [Solanum commersonii]|uniref:Uncharacterized protein n=1 Tax=Solanum commersonii TaxID=4109 RepID=A0A9J5X404_SOLCO|nr:hypothetical protein H5410_052655 [Solanum commersonii]